MGNDNKIPEDARHARTGGAFASTRWTLLLGLAEADETTRRRCMEELATSYWPPIYAWFRRRGHPRHDALERTQAFFETAILERRLFDRADPEKGRLRSLILTALRRFDIDAHRHRNARGGSLNVSLDAIDREEALLLDQNGAADPDAHFTSRWDLAVVEDALREAEAHFTSRDKSGHWRAFELHVLLPACGKPAAPLQEIAKTCGFDSPAAAAAAVQVVKKRLKTIVESKMEPEDDPPRPHENGAG